MPNFAGCSRCVSRRYNAGDFSLLWVARMLSVEGLTKTFESPGSGVFVRLLRGARNIRPTTTVNAVRGVNFRVADGTIVGLLGPNGAGKTTLMRCLSTALTPTQGTAFFNGVDIVKEPIAVRRTLGFLSGTTGLYGRLTPRELVEYYGVLNGMELEKARERTTQLFEFLELAPYAERRCDALSAGLKQKVSIARTLVHDPEIVIFDEPTTGLDVLAAQAILTLVRECKQKHKTVLFSTHNMHEVESLCDVVVLLSEGRVAFTGTPSEMLEKSGKASLEQAFLSLVGREPVKGSVS